MYAEVWPDGSTTLFFNRSRCRNPWNYVAHPWDIYKIDGAGR